MKNLWRDIVILVLVTIFSTLAVWLPFSLGMGKGMLTVFANYDGPNYLIIAKSLYDSSIIKSSFSLPLPVEYYPAHFPGYPLLIKSLSFLLPGTWAMLMATLLTSIAAVIAFYLFVRKFNFTSAPLWLSIIFLFFPARWLVVRSVGSPEPLFIAALLTSFYFFKSVFGEPLFVKNKNIFLDFWLAAIFGVIAQITKTPAILLFLAYGAWLTARMLQTKQILWRAFPLLLIPLAIIPVFWLYKIQTGDFLAYFHSGDNFHLVFPPFQSFIMERSWLGDFWLEDMIWVYLLGALTVILLFQRKLYDLASFALIFFVATLFVSHRDLSRYSLPLVPFALIAFAPFLERKEFKIAFFFILIPIYLYAINFIAHNTAPVADWTPYL